MESYEVLVYLANKGITIELVDRDVYKIHGFYKSGDVIIDINTKMIRDRYSTMIIDETNLLEQLINLNVYWHEYSKERWSGWVDMEPVWKKLLEEYNGTT